MFFCKVLRKTVKNFDFMTLFEIIFKQCEVYSALSMPIVFIVFLIGISDG